MSEAAHSTPNHLTPKTWSFVIALALAGLTTFALTLFLHHVQIGASKQFARAGYCSVAGDTDVDGAPLHPGTFLDLLVGEPAVDGHYTGAVPATFVKGVGLTCAAPPAGYVRQGFASGGGQPGTGIYPYFAPPRS